MRDHTGERYGYLTVIKYAGSTRKDVLWLCKCDCGNEKIVPAKHLCKGVRSSCGCINVNITHGGTGTRLYNIWAGMKQRCYDEKDPTYLRYWKKGITVCDEWKYNFPAFRKWALEHGYKEDLSIDRIDNSKGYSPDNCRWATAKEQSNNKTSNRVYVVNGITGNIMQLSEIFSIEYSTALARINRGWTAERAFTVPTKNGNYRRKKAHNDE